jgi:hypothetical protein
MLIGLRSVTIVSTTLAHSDMSRVTATKIHGSASFNDHKYLLLEYHEIGNCDGLSLCGTFHPSKDSLISLVGRCMALC